VHQLRLSRSQFILTHPLFVKTAIAAAKEVGIPESNILLVSSADNLPFITIPDLIKIGETAPEIVPLTLTRGESKRKVALLNFSSGTSGLAKGVLITHSNVIANVCQLYIHEGAGRGNWEGIANGCLPFFHSNIPFFLQNLISSLWSGVFDALAT
jgi:acyl-CoA synthetase (AMP-forming)/AMP-acid ligase II